jgi:hypothetical protein
LEGRHYRDNEFGKWRAVLDSYELNIVEISDIDEPQELNLLFLRLQLGTILNSGEKLNAMTGDMRDFIFDEFAKHDFFSAINIPYRRFAHEQVAAQIACNIFNVNRWGEFARTRYIDLQVFFKDYKTLESGDKKIIRSIMIAADAAVKALGKRSDILRNRAMTVSFFLYFYDLLREGKEKSFADFVSFYEKLLQRLRWQIRKGLDIDREYTDLIRLQTDITQASVEKPAVVRRCGFIEHYFGHYQKHKEIIGDREYKQRTGIDPPSEF